MKAGSQPEPGTPASLIVTVRDDRQGLIELIDAIERQTEMPNEIVVVDGGSQDGTLDELRRWGERVAPVEVVVAPGTNIGAGRNIAVQNARHDWLICTDAGCRPVPEWFSVLRGAHGTADVVAGTFAVEGESLFERSLACAHYPVLDEVHDPSFLVRLSHMLFGRDFRAVYAGGRSMAFSRAAWVAAGGFPENVNAGEDLAFSAAAIELGYRAKLMERALVLWRPRATVLENARMFVTYSRGDIRTKGRSRHLARLIAWTLGPAVAARGGWRSRFVIALGFCAYVWLPLRRAGRVNIAWQDRWRIVALVVLKDVSQLVGAAAGLLDALRDVPRPDRRSA